MPVNFSNLTYSGEYFAEVFGPTILEAAGLIDNGLALPLDQTKFKQTLNEIDDTVDFQDPSPAFNDQGTQADVGEVNIAAVPYEFHKEISWKNIRQAWLNSQLRPGSLNDYEADQITQDFIAKIYAKKLQLAQSYLVLNGKVGLSSRIGTFSFSQSYNGLYPLLNASSDVQKLSLTSHQLTVASVQKGAKTVLVVAGDKTGDVFPGNRISIRNAAGTGWAAINTDVRILSVQLSGGNTEIQVDLDTSSLTNTNYTGDSAAIRYINRTNIVGVMANHLAFIPDEVRRQGAPVVMPNHLELEWQFANAEAQKNGGSFYLSAYQMKIISQNIVVLDMAPANTLGSWAENRVGYAYDLNEDVSNVELIWQGDKTADKLYRLRGAMKTGVEISQKFANEITLTTPEG